MGQQTSQKGKVKYKCCLDEYEKIVHFNALIDFLCFQI